MTLNFAVIPTGARSAKWRDLFCCCVDEKRSLGYAALRAASLGMTGKIAIARASVKRSVPMQATV